MSDQRALGVLWKSNRRWVAAIILAHRPRSVDVEDLMQEVAVKFVSKVRTLRDPASFRPWLRQIAINACRGAARRDRPTLRLSGSDEIRAGEVATPASPAPAAGPAVERLDDATRLMDRLATLPSEYREPLLMRCVQEMSYQQIADILELPVTTVETRLARARRMIREEMSAQNETEGSA